jgi:putative ABC transport system permease protein
MRFRPPALRAPRILGLSATVPLTLYVWRVRRRPAQELLAAAGIAVGVALVFGVLVANSGITGSADRLVHQIIGSARLQLAARSEAGFSERIAERAAYLPGVEVASPVLREDATVVGPAGSEQVQLLGIVPSLRRLNPEATRNLGAGELLIYGGLGLPSSVAATTGAQTDEKVTLNVGGMRRSVLVRTTLGTQTIGAIAESPVVIALLPVAQTLTGKPGLVSTVLVKPRPGAERRVAEELRALAAGRVDVTPADAELSVLDTAAKPTQQSTTLFAVIAGMVGFLLALNAIMLTVPERRRFIAELRTFGYDPPQIILILAVQAVALGLIGSAVGIAAGYVLAHTLWSQVPDYLTVAFLLGAQKIVTASTVLIAVGCGVLAALLASLRPLLDLRPRVALDAVMHEQGEAGQSVTRRVTVALALTGAALVLVTTILSLAVPRLTIIGGVLLALAAGCLIPLAYTGVLAALTPLGDRSRGMLSHALVELEATATRSIALAAIAALAVYGSLAVGGARRDLTRGLETAIAQDSSMADIWVTTGENVFNTTSFRSGGVPAAIARTPGVASVRADNGGLIDIDGRRLLIRVHQPNTPEMLQSTQLLHGNFAQATRLMRGGGWASVSDGFAAEHHLKVGDRFALPTPAGALRLGVAAITTNLGWPPGAITFSTADYLRGWQRSEPSALEVNLKPGIGLQAGRKAIQAALGPDSALQVWTFKEREARADGNLRQGLRSLGQISTLLLITGALAIAASLSAAIWQRRGRLSAMKTWGYDNLQLWRSLLLESTIVLGVGCADGTVLGVYGHVLADRWLGLTTGFPAPFAVGGPLVLIPLAVVAGVALAVVALPGLAAAQVAPSVSFQE